MRFFVITNSDTIRTSTLLVFAAPDHQVECLSFVALDDFLELCRVYIYDLRVSFEADHEIKVWFNGRF